MGERRRADYRILVHDFSGHPFQVQLARQLARNGASVVHAHCPSFQTPKGNVEGDEEGADFEASPIALRRPFSKYSAGKRLLQEFEYGIRLIARVRKVAPDVLITANTPLIAALTAQVGFKLLRLPIVFWQQDIYSAAMAGHLRRNFGTLGKMGGRLLEGIERWLLSSSDGVVVISEDFLATLEEWKVDLDAVTVVENWAPLDELPQSDRPNQWSQRHSIDDNEVVFLYAGTLGLKHEPSVLAELAREFADDPHVRLIVASEGRGATWLARELHGSAAIELLDFQPFADLADMLATADVVIALLEPSAGGFSVPSKVLTYHCAGRPILGAMPADNLASRIIARNRSGVIVPPGDAEAFIAAASSLREDREGREAMGTAARNYAERAFDIVDITERFESVIDRAVERRHAR